MVQMEASLWSFSITCAINVQGCRFNWFVGTKCHLNYDENGHAFSFLILDLKNPHTNILFRTFWASRAFHRVFFCQLLKDCHQLLRSWSSYPWVPHLWCQNAIRSKHHSQVSQRGSLLKKITGTKGQFQFLSGWMKKKSVITHTHTITEMQVLSKIKDQHCAVNI